MDQSMKINDPNIKYWVGSDSDEPLRIMFTAVYAQNAGYRYLDAFNAAGVRIAGFKLVDGKYTTDF